MFIFHHSNDTLVGTVELFINLYFTIELQRWFTSYKYKYTGSILRDIFKYLYVTLDERAFSVTAESHQRGIDSLNTAFSVTAEIHHVALTV